MRRIACAVALVSAALALGVNATARADVVLFATESTRREELAEALRVEVAPAELRVIDLRAPHELTDSAAAAVVLRERAQVLLWLTQSDNPLEPPIIHAILANQSSAHTVRAAQALDVLDARVFAITAAALLEPAPPVPCPTAPPPVASVGETRPDASDSASNATESERTAADARSEAATPVAVSGTRFLRPKIGFLTGLGLTLRLREGEPAVGPAFWAGVGVYARSWIRSDVLLGFDIPTDGRWELFMMAIGATVLQRVGAARLDLGLHATMGGSRRELDAEGTVGLTGLIGAMAHASLLFPIGDDLWLGPRVATSALFPVELKNQPPLATSERQLRIGANLSLELNGYF